MVDPAVGAMLAGAFALLFVSAALDKLRSLQRFAEVFRGYRLLPESLARLSWLVPALEFTVGVGLLARRSRAGASAAGAALLVAYAAAIAINLQRGRRDLACGCGGPHERRPIAAWMVWRKTQSGVGFVLGRGLPYSNERPLCSGPLAKETRPHPGAMRVDILLGDSPRTLSYWHRFVEYGSSLGIGWSTLISSDQIRRCLKYSTNLQF